MRRFSRPAHLFYLLHRFNYVGIHTGLALNRVMGLRLYRLRDLMIAVDGLLSVGFYLTLLATPVATVISVVTTSPLLALAALLFNLIYVALRHKERQLQRGHWLLRLCIHNVDLGSARTLRGRLTVGHIFVDPLPMSWWTHGRVAASMEHTRHADAWLSREAGAYGVDLELQHEVVARGVKISRPPALGADPTTVEHDAVVEAVARDAVAFAATARDDVDGTCLVVHLPYETTSFACPRYYGSLRKLPVEWCVLSVNASSSVLAHELLHLFGADDHYHCLSETELQAKQELIGRSIMFNTYPPLVDLVVDEVTAQNIGWS